VPAAPGAHPDLAALAQRFTTTPREDVLDVAASAVRAGATADTLLGAALLAGVHEIRPRTVGGKLHSVMMIESAFQLAAGAPAEDTLRLALWSVDDFKASQAHDADAGDWRLPPRPAVSFADAAAARKELDAAMEAWDEERADRAIVGLVERADHDAVFEALWPWAARCFGFIGHKIIHAAQLDRALRRIGWRHAEPVLRTVAHALVARPGRGHDVRAYEAALPRIAKLPAGWLEGKEAPEQSAQILAGMRARGAAEAQDLVLEAFADGLSPATVWDGLRLFASELFLRRTASRPARSGAAILPVHAVTETEAFGHVFRTARADTTKRLAVLQAAGWLALMRDALQEHAGLSLRGPGIEALSAGEAASDAGAVLAAPTPARALGLLERRPEQGPALRRALVALMARKAEEHHQHKYAAAALVEAERANPRWAPRILAAALPYLPVPADPETEVGARMERALRKAGLS
jgi:hypothetical protein